MSTSVLILAPDQDVHAKAVARELGGLNCKAVIWSARKLPQETLLRFELGSSNDTVLIDEAGNHDLQEFDSVWHRRPGIPRACDLANRWLEAMVAWESGRALEGLYRTLSKSLWVNDPQAQQETLIKIKQLKTAQETGFVIPDTLVTNDPEAVREFCRRYSNHVVYKLVDEASRQYFPDKELPHGIPTLAFRTEDLQHLDQVKLSLHLFQQKIDKHYDVRVTVVGQQVFAVKVEPQAKGAQLDWRLDPDSKLSSYALPDEVKSKCLALMQRLGLVFAAFDLCLSKDGQYVFFEVNPQGQFLWLEEALQLPIAHALARLLARLSPL